MQKLASLAAAILLLSISSQAQFYKKVLPGNNIAAAVVNITENF